MVFDRILQLNTLMNKKSFYLFGPRATGKSFLIRQQFTDDMPIINLLRGDMYLHLSAKPYELEAIINSYDNQKIVVIDEVQRIPELLNEVHRLIEEKHIKFLLTGSSARKLRQKGVNLLAGRAWEARLFPLVSSEIPQFDLNKYLLYGGLPAVYSSAEPEEELQAYVNTYLQEEIQAEALVRKIPAFSRFLQLAALASGEMINFSSIANDSGIPVSTIREYYHILEDTFIGFLVPAWVKSLKRKPITTAKFYFFDIGVKNTLAQIKSLESKTDLYGQAFEHFIALELRAYLSYRRLSHILSYWRTKHGHEVDFIVGDEIAIEVKTSDKITDKHLKNLKLLAEEKICKRYMILSNDKINRKQGVIEIIYWQDFIKQLWNNKIVESN